MTKKLDSKTEEAAAKRLNSYAVQSATISEVWRSGGHRFYVQGIVDGPHVDLILPDGSHREQPFEVARLVRRSIRLHGLRRLLATKFPSWWRSSTIQAKLERLRLLCVSTNERLKLLLPQEGGSWD